MQAYYPNTPTPQQIKPITCPRCGSRELAFVTEYHKATCSRIFSTILFIIFCAFGIFIIPEFLSEPFTFNDPEAVFVFVSAGLGALTLKIIQHSIESKTHVQAICRDCGRLWLLN